MICTTKKERCRAGKTERKICLGYSDAIPQESGNRVVIPCQRAELSFASQRNEEQRHKDAAEQKRYGKEGEVLHPCSFKAINQRQHPWHQIKQICFRKKRGKAFFDIICFGAADRPLRYPMPIKRSRTKGSIRGDRSIVTSLHCQECSNPKEMGRKESRL